MSATKKYFFLYYLTYHSTAVAFFEGNNLDKKREYPSKHTTIGSF